MVQNTTKIQVEERAVHIESVTTVRIFTIRITFAVLHYGIDCAYIYNLQCFSLRTDTHTHCFFVLTVKLFKERN